VFSHSLIISGKDVRIEIPSIANIQKRNQFVVNRDGCILTLYATFRSRCPCM
jgi:hypothetical protein